MREPTPAQVELKRFIDAACQGVYLRTGKMATRLYLGRLEQDALYAHYMNGSPYWKADPTGDRNPTYGAARVIPVALDSHIGAYI